jgi:hypothetical protein
MERGRSACFISLPAIETTVTAESQWPVRIATDEDFNAPREEVVMSMYKVLLTMMGMWCVASVAQAQAGSIGSPRTVAVRVYEADPVSAQVMRRAHAIAATIFHETGINVGWVSCSMPNRPFHNERCDEPLSESYDVAMRLIASEPSQGIDEVLGRAHLDDSGHLGVLASIYTDRVVATATRLGLDPATLLGRVMAHEIGHLLGWRHSLTGLMRPHWPVGDLRRPHSSDFVFALGSPDD